MFRARASALCWIVRAGDFYYVSNTGSNNVSGYRIDAGGNPTLIGPTGIVATTEPGPIGMTVAGGGRFLYVQTGTTGTVDEFRVNGDGSPDEAGRRHRPTSRPGRHRPELTTSSSEGLASRLPSDGRL